MTTEVVFYEDQKSTFAVTSKGVFVFTDIDTDDDADIMEKIDTLPADATMVDGHNISDEAVPSYILGEGDWWEALISYGPDPTVIDSARCSDCMDYHETREKIPDCDGCSNLDILPVRVEPRIVVMRKGGKRLEIPEAGEKK